MRLINFFPTLLLAVERASSLELGHAHRARSGSIQWSPCLAELNGTVPMQCGNLSVPLDYTRTLSNASFVLDVFRTPATKQPSRGSIFLNFGGPGADGRADLSAFAPQLLAATGSEFDLVSWVPRGTGVNTSLELTCFGSDLERVFALAYTFPITSGNASNAAPGAIWADSTIFSDNCLSTLNRTGGFVGTAFAVRDMMSILDALGEDGMLRYWGISYGTALGSTAISMFPEKVDKVILDGVVNPHEYYHNYEPESLTDADKVFSGFCHGCVNNPTNCVLARNQTGDELEEEIYAYLEDLKFNPIPISYPGGGMVVDYSLLKTTIYNRMYYPFLWPLLAADLNSFITGNLTAIAEFYTTFLSTPATGAPDALPGIKCSDKIARATSREDPLLVEGLQGRYKSRIGGDVADTTIVRCATWRMDAVEQYTGDFHVQTKNPVLLIGNTADPVTPLVSAHNASAGFEGSVVLQQDSFGHTSWIQASLCTARATRAYFINGTLPAPGTICPIDATLFSGLQGWEEVIPVLLSEEN
ncbi:hypothetical protein K402DRAFT_425805 [Aulographum hederae CBS 113979]|uniref:Peptidase S33 tripeptidyl aminopeptidase-like C-terminal domain-containing protein n=1 Tax=Aulographum hederae CBS 113979 TaxID=1176131 RepID=A0A6G1GJ65_9PEZI|nr:hypothetical protein K402DRAFT_425805 [Aulographum hederae CBS 113979]